MCQVGKMSIPCYSKLNQMSALPQASGQLDFRPFLASSDLIDRGYVFIIFELLLPIIHWYLICISWIHKSYTFLMVVHAKSFMFCRMPVQNFKQIMHQDWHSGGSTGKYIQSPVCSGKELLINLGARFILDLCTAYRMQNI